MSFVPANTKMLPQYSLVKLTLSKDFNKYVVGECKQNQYDKRFVKPTCRLHERGYVKFIYLNCMRNKDLREEISSK